MRTGGGCGSGGAGWDPWSRQTLSLSSCNGEMGEQALRPYTEFYGEGGSLSPLLFVMWWALNPETFTLLAQQHLAKKTMWGIEIFRLICYHLGNNL